MQRSVAFCWKGRFLSLGELSPVPSLERGFFTSPQKGRHSLLGARYIDKRPPWARAAVLKRPTRRVEQRRVGTATTHRCVTARHDR